jgi:MarC family membrane protein
MTLQSLLYIFLSSLAALFPVMNPIGNGFIVNGAMGDIDEAARRQAIKKITLNCLMIGLGSLAVGHLILLLFGLAVPVIQVAGGILICKTGMEWLSDPASPNIDTPSDHEVRKMDISSIQNKLFYPLSFPICLGPGSISVIFTLMASANVQDNLLSTTVHYAFIALAIVTVLAIMYVMLSQSKRLTRKMGASGNLIVNKMIAFITFCIGVQILVTGISKVFHLTIL